MIGRDRCRGPCHIIRVPFCRRRHRYRFVRKRRTAGRVVCPAGLVGAHVAPDGIPSCERVAVVHERNLHGITTAPS